MTDTNEDTPPPTGVIDPVTPTSATRADIEDDWPPDRFVTCRREVGGHQWHHHKPKIEGGLILLASSCSNCGTTRAKTFDGDGNRIKTKYKYRDGYITKTKRKPYEWRDRFVANTLGELG
mgnify:CR=1 FL=1